MSTNTNSKTTYYVRQFPEGKTIPVCEREQFTRIVNRIRARSLKKAGNGWQLIRADGSIIDYAENPFGQVQWPVLIGENKRLANRGLLAY